MSIRAKMMLEKEMKEEEDQRIREEKEGAAALIV
jgi:hypothetical protein